MREKKESSMRIKGKKKIRLEDAKQEETGTTNVRSTVYKLQVWAVFE